MHSESFDVRVQSITWLAHGIHSVILETVDQRPLPAAQAGAHIDVHLRDRLTRSYSLVGHGGKPCRYEIAVAKDANSRGGSRYIHDELRVGQDIRISAPRNLFPLVDSAAPSVLIAGGIGITPLWSMVQTLEAQGRAWTLHYAARSRRHAAYLENIEALAAQSRCGQLVLHFDDEQGKPPNMQGWVQSAPAGAHVYCCGPQAMLAAYESATASLPAAQVHMERFSAAPASADDGSFKLVLARSGKEFSVPAGQSILDVLLENAIDAQYGCMQGACGICEMKVLEGTPEHRDSLLSDEVKAANQSILICCSRSQTPSLTLDA